MGGESINERSGLRSTAYSLRFQLFNPEVIREKYTIHGQ
jgi:hypothetical protein